MTRAEVFKQYWRDEAHSPWRNVDAAEVLSDASWNVVTSTEADVPQNKGWRKALLNFFRRNEQSLDPFYNAFDSWVRGFNSTNCACM